MIMLEVAWFCFLIIYLFSLIYYILNRGKDIDDWNIFDVICLFFVPIGGIVIMFFYFSVLDDLGVGEWIEWCWLDFWTTEVSLESVLIGLLIVSIKVFLIYIWINLKECECETLYLRGKYCRKCGKKRDA